MASGRRGIPRPTAVTKPALALAAVSAALFGIAKTTGSGWLIVLLAALGAVVVLSVALPSFGVLRVAADLEAPRDGVVGHPLTLSLGVTGTRLPVTATLVGPVSSAATTVPGAATGRIEATPQWRGVVEAIDVEIRCGAPLGLVWWRRRVTCDLPRPIEVGPWPADMTVPPPTGAGPRGHEARSAPHTGDDLVRGAREYRPGDPIKTIHWTASARQGDLMVKELEAAAAPPLTVAVDLRVGGDRAEAVASWAAGVAVGALDAGIPVTLLTCERDGPASGPVAARTEVSRRLARAIPGRVGDPSPDAGRVVVVDAGGVHW